MLALHLYIFFVSSSYLLMCPWVYVIILHFIYLCKH